VVAEPEGSTPVTPNRDTGHDPEPVPTNTSNSLAPTVLYSIFSQLLVTSGGRRLHP